MKKALLGTCFALALSGATAAPALAGSAGTAPQPREVGLAGAVALSNCSGSLVRMPDSEPADPALVLTNGHCLDGDMPAPGEVRVDEPTDRQMVGLKGDDSGGIQLTATKLVYGTMTDTDAALYELNQTYQEIEDKSGIKALELSEAKPEQGAQVTVASGYWKKLYKCSVDGFAHELHEADWIWKDSVRYTAECDTVGGTSGSPLIEDASGKVVGVNNTINTDGEECTLDNPCEVDENGRTTVHKGIGYAQETHMIPGCFDKGNKLNLDAEGCTLPKPKAN